MFQDFNVILMSHAYTGAHKELQVVYYCLVSSEGMLLRSRVYGGWLIRVHFSSLSRPRAFNNPLLSIGRYRQQTYWYEIVELILQPYYNS
jgi:hypothetical protein